MELTLVTDSTPDQEPVSLAEAKAYLRLDTTDDDGTIQTLITAARMEAENEQGRELSPKQWMLALDEFPRGGRFEDRDYWIPAGGRYYGFRSRRSEISLLDPLSSVDTFRWRDSSGSFTALTENTTYIVDLLKHPGIVCPAFGQTWPSGDMWPSSAVQLGFTAGMTPDIVPAHLKQGIMLLVSQWYEGRIPFEAIRFVAELPFSVSSLFRNNKLWKF